MPYWVSPLVRDQTVGPKPTMNWGTRMPNLRAHMKWPNSWKPIENSRPIAKATIPRVVRRIPLSSASGDDTPGVLPGPLLRRQDVLDAGGDAEVRRVVEGTRDEVDDAPERQPTRHEGRDGLLVGGVVERRDDAAGLPGQARQAHGREGHLVEGGELPGARRRPVQGGLDDGQPVGPGQ